MVNRYRLIQTIRYLLFAVLFGGCYGLHLLFHGDFDLSIWGALGSLPVTVLLYKLDVKVKASTHDRRGKQTAAIAVLCFFFYFTFSAYIITRSGHELVARPTKTEALVTRHLSGNARGRLDIFPSCKFVVSVRSPVRRDYCATREEFDLLQQAPTERLTWQSKAWLITNDSALGSTIVSLVGRM